MEGALGIEARVVSYAQQGDVGISRILHFADHVLNAVFINEVVKAFFKDVIKHPRQRMGMQAQFFCRRT